MSNLEINTENCKKIWREAKKYLQDKGVPEKTIEKHLDAWRNSKPESLEDVMENILFSSTNKSIWSGQTDRSKKMIEDFNNSLEGFNVSEIIEKYDNAKEIFETVKSPDIIYDFESNPQTKGVTLAKCLFDSSHFLKQFRNFEEFDEFCQKFARDERIDVRGTLPLVLKERIHGLGFPTACEFLKENGYPQYAKPDTHIKDIFCGIGISKSGEDYPIFRDVIRFSKQIERYPYNVDKLFWLVGSSNFYLSEREINRRIKTDKDEFIEIINSINYK